MRLKTSILMMLASENLLKSLKNGKNGGIIS